MVHYSNADGLPQSQVLSIAQDSRGYLWVGTQGGLGRYDGREFHTLTREHGLLADQIWDLEPAPDGSLWVATARGVCSISPSMHISPRCPAPPGETTTDVLPLDDMLLVTASSGYLLDTGTGIELLLAHGGGRLTHRPCRLASGAVILPARDDLYRYEAGRLEGLGIRGWPEHAFIAAEWKGQLVIGAADGVYRVHEGTAEHILEVDSVRALLPTPQMLWAGTHEGLLQSPDGVRWSTVNHRPGLDRERILALARDREGLVWVGTNTGLDKIPFTSVRSFDAADGLPDGIVWCLHDDPQLGLLAAGDGGVARLVGESFETVVIAGVDLAHGRVRSLHRANDDSLWVCTSHQGCIRIDRQGRASKLTQADGTPLGAVFSIAEDAEGILWLGTSSGAIAVVDGRASRHGASQGIPVDFIWQAVTGPEGEVWMATDAGPVKRVGDRFEVPTFASDIWLCRNISFDSEGRIWIGTNGNGLYIWDGTTLEHRTRATGFPDDVVWGLLPGLPGETWVGTNRGLVRLTTDSSVVINSTDGLPGDEMTVNTCLKDRHGNLWFGLMPGLVEIEGGRIEANPIEPQVVIASLQTNLRRLDPSATAVITPAENEVVFHIDGLTFQNEWATRYRFRLLGFDDWSAPTHSDVVRYTRLAPGRYTFQARASNSFGVWSSRPATVAVRVVPAWHQHAAIRLFAAAVLAAVILAWFRLRTERSRRIQAELKREVEERTHDLYEASIRDSLLGIFNRRHIDAVVADKIDDARRHGDAMCLAILDLDRFKEVNDRHGHLVGDAVLCRVAATLQGSIRATDLLGRFGGDEFILVFVRTSTEAIPKRLQGIVEAIAAADFADEAPDVSITVSIGAVCHRFSPPSEVSYDDLLVAADRTLYEAKASGTNRYMLVLV